MVCQASDLSAIRSFALLQTVKFNERGFNNNKTQIKSIPSSIGGSLMSMRHFFVIVIC